MQVITMNVDSIESFTEWLKEINSIDDNALRKKYAAMTDAEIVNGLLNNEIDKSVFHYLSMQRAKSITDILELRF
jgi:hypothetical protein